jgi:PKD domain
MATLSVALLLTAAPAGAIVETVPTGSGPEEVEVGLQPPSTTLHVGAEVNGEEPKKFANPIGAPVVTTNKTYAIYWDPTDSYHGDWQGVIDTFFQNMGAGSGSLASVYAVDAQYTDAANQHADYASTFQGAYTDTDPYPTSGPCVDPHKLEGNNYPWNEPAAITCITNTQIETELKTFIADHKLPTGMGTIFYLLTPPGVTVCLDKGGPGGHCSDFNGTVTEVLKYEEERRSYPERLKKYEKETNSYPERLKKYEDNKAEDEKNKVNDTETEPTKPVKPIYPAEPSGYPDYEKSFCSYHSDINPGNPTNGGPGTILYAAVPWIAGGLADGHLPPSAQTPAYDCQDGGFNPSSKPVEEPEKAKEKSSKEETEFNEKDQEEKTVQEKAEVLAGPHEQEPNQVTCPSPDGYCDTGLADLIISQIGSEQQNIVTDPLLNGWQQQTPALRNEATDECRNFFAPTTGGSVAANAETFAGTLSNQTFGTGNYYLNDAFNLAALNLPYPGIPCLSGIRLEPKFTAPNPVKSGEIVGFDGMESNITLNEGTAYTGTTPSTTYAKYTWKFGDGSPEVTGFAPGAPTQNSPESSPCPTWLSPCAASVSHSYQSPGDYNVTLTVTDTGGNEATVTHPITVVPTQQEEEEAKAQAKREAEENAKRAAEAKAKSEAEENAKRAAEVKAKSAAEESAKSAAEVKASAVPAPVATAAVLSRSLKSVLASGLIVRYSVNEQVAGQFQVLLAASVAKRIGLHGPAAVGLPAGSPPSIVIGKAILITTKGGHSTVKILFGKKTAAKLRKLRKVTVMLRLTVRNASSHSPLSTTVLTPVTLSR